MTDDGCRQQEQPTRAGGCVNRTYLVLFRRFGVPMLKISRLTHYGLLATVYLARHHGRVVSAREIASFYHLPLPMITKVLKTLGAAGAIDRKSTRLNSSHVALSRMPS